MAAPIVTSNLPPGSYPVGVQFVLTADQPATIYYTINGTPATLSSRKYFVPLSLAPNDYVVNYLAVNVLNETTIGSFSFEINTDGTDVASFIVLDHTHGETDVMPASAGYYGQRTRAATCVDSKAGTITSYYVEKDTLRWVKVVSAIPPGSTPFSGLNDFNYNASWRKFKSAGNRYQYQPTKVVIFPKKQIASLDIENLDNTRDIKPNN